MARAEAEPAFLDALRAHGRTLAPQFDPRLEREAWRRLLAELAPERPHAARTGERE